MFERYVEVTPEEPAALVTLEDVKAFLDISSDSSDAELTAFIAVASQMVEAYCNRLFSTRTVVEKFILEESVSSMILERSPIISLTSIECDGNAVDVAGLYVNKSAAIIRKSDGTVFEFGNYEIEYQGGRAATPDPVAQAVKELVRDMRDAKKRPAGVASESVPDVGEVTYSELYTSKANGVAVSPTVAALLSPYVLRYS